MMKCLYLLSVVFHVAAGCALSGDKVVVIYGHKGGSVLLPCSCSDLHTKPQKSTWESDRTRRLAEMLNDEHYRGRLQLFNNISAANLSLLISDLREEDQGAYRCSTEKKYRDIRLFVKGCKLVKKAKVENVTVFTGESVVLPCVCTDLQDKPKTVTWEFTRTNHSQEIYPEQTGHHRNRVKLVSKNSPGNLSLLISDLTKEDQGLYRCSVQADRRVFRLSVKGTETSSEQQTHSSLHQVFGILAVLLLVIPAVVALIFWRCRGGRCGENVITEGRQDCKRKQEVQTVPDVIYSTVTHINTAGAARVQINTGEKTEYASIITN